MKSGGGGGGDEVDGQQEPCQELADAELQSDAEDRDSVATRAAPGSGSTGDVKATAAGSVRPAGRAAAQAWLEERGFAAVAGQSGVLLRQVLQSTQRSHSVSDSTCLLPRSGHREL